MKRIGIAGDWHHNLPWAVESIKRFKDKDITTVYHVGDFGIYSHAKGQVYLDETNMTCSSAGLKILITPGNHEDYTLINSIPVGSDGIQWIRPNLGLLPRGYRWEIDGRTFVSLGGAASIGFTSQTAGVDWWPEEQITMQNVLDISSDGTADVMITHEAPNGIENVRKAKSQSGGEWLEIELYYAYESQKNMTMAVEAVEPKVLFHGHYHCGYEENVLFTNLEGEGFTIRVVGMNMDSQHRNLGIFTPATYDFEWIK